MHKNIAKKFLIVLLSILTLFHFAGANTEIFAVGNSSIVFSKSREPTKKIALTFDDGPHPRYTERILNILDKYHIKATFFVIGVNIQNYPAPLKKIYESGHEIGNHSFSHDNQNDLNSLNAVAEMKKCQDLIIKETGIAPRLFRPPRGACNSDVIDAAKTLGYSVVLWSIDTLDWKGTPSQIIASAVEKQAHGGDIILMHDYTSLKNTTCDALEIIIPRLLARGYKFVTVSELIEQL